MRLSALLALLMPLTVSAQTVWEMPTPYGAGNFQTDNTMQFAADVTRATGGRVTIEVHPGGTLIRHPEIKDAVRSGRVAIGEVLLSQLSSEDPLFEVDSVPFLASDYDKAARLWEASRPAIEERLGEQGVRVLYAVPWPGQGLYSIKPLQDAEAMRGVYFRAYNPITRQLARQLHAAPIHVEVPDVGLAFALNRVEAMITSPTTGVGSKAWEYVRFYYDVQAWLPKNAILVNEAAFSALSRADQQAILAAARQAETRGWAASRIETETATNTLRQNGMLVLPPSESLTNKLAQAGEAITADWVASTGAVGQRVMRDYVARQMAQAQ